MEDPLRGWLNYKSLTDQLDRHLEGLTSEALWVSYRTLSSYRLVEPELVSPVNTRRCR